MAPTNRKGQVIGMRFELVVVWTDGSKNTYEYNSRAAAEKGERGMRMANGNQIAWSGVRPVYK